MTTPPDAAAWQGRVLVVGAGLIGTSVALAARAAGAEVLITDADEQRAALAASVGAGERVVAGETDPTDPVDLVVVAVPPRAIAPVAAAALRSRIGATVTHVGSVQAQPLLDTQLLGVKMQRFVGGHPVAGAERAGPGHASAELFRDRPWVVCPGPDSAADAVDAVAAFARACGAVPVVMDPERHDRLFAYLSHVPQLVASALAASLVELSAADAALAGAGVRDTTRLAESDPALWAEIVDANRQAVADGLRAVAAPLQSLADELSGSRSPATESVRALVARGRAGRRLLPGKHGGARQENATLEVLVPDEPGSLAALFTAIAQEGVNLEDVRVDHAPGRPLGVAEIAVAPTNLAGLVRALRAAGWSVTADLPPARGDGAASAGEPG